jgi:ABC-2 type transport system ATP-binding protein
MAEPVLAIRDISFAYERRKVLEHVSLVAEAGRATMLLGPNGAGKSTLFALIARLIAPQDGAITIQGRDLFATGAAALGPVGFVFQQSTLDLDLTVAENLTYFAGLRGLSRAQTQSRIEAELAAFDMQGRAGATVRTLNGGHRRRVEIARALMSDPALLMLDEPTVGLDIPTRKALVQRLHARAREAGTAVFWATHLIDEVERGDHVVMLAQGRVVARGTADEICATSGQPDLGAAFDALTASPRAQDRAQDDAA